MYRTLEDIARQKKVSLAWVVREAIDQYITAKWPLFKGQV
jgi:predicted transcriptional regulator